MKLLFDQNLSFKLVAALADLFPRSAHVSDLGLQRAGDLDIWARARSDGFAIVSKDDDLHQRAFFYGAPPKVIWLDLGNCTTAHVEECLRRNVDQVLQFEADPQASFLVLSRV